MKFSSTLAIAALAALNAEIASARCFLVGYGYSSKDEAKGWANDACRNNGGMFTGNYAPGQKKSMCPETKYNAQGNARKVKFEVTNLNNNQGFDLGDDDCYKRLVSEIDSCRWGGETTVAGWKFR
jgi:hypothetical protein